LNKAKDEEKAEAKAEEWVKEKAKAEAEGLKGGRAEWEIKLEAKDFEPVP